jgi:amidophosphoribosyltransferase
VHLRIASPPLVAPCRYGVDIADTTSLIAAGRDPDAVGDLLGATSLRYLSLASLHAAIAPAGDGLCTSCFVRQRPAARSADTRVAVPAG